MWQHVLPKAEFESVGEMLPFFQLALHAASPELFRHPRHGGGRSHSGLPSRSPTNTRFARTSDRLGLCHVFLAHQTLAHGVWDALGPQPRGLHGQGAPPEPAESLNRFLPQHALVPQFQACSMTTGKRYSIYIIYIYTVLICFTFTVRIQCVAPMVRSLRCVVQI